MELTCAFNLNKYPNLNEWDDNDIGWHMHHDNPLTLELSDTFIVQTSNRLAWFLVERHWSIKFHVLTDWYYYASF
jgi:hypothetical protein